MTTRGEHGQLLYDFLRTEWDSMGLSRSAWCRKVQLPDSTVLRWGQGSEPDMYSLEMVATGLPGRTLLDLIVVAGYLSEEEAQKRPVPLRPPADVVEAIRLDPNISEHERESLAQLHDAFKIVGSGRASTVRVRSRARARVH